MERNLRPAPKSLDDGERMCQNGRARTRFDGVPAAGRRSGKGTAVPQKPVNVDVDLLSWSERAAALEEVRKLNPLCSFPTILIGDTVVVGNREDKIREALGLS
jgi:hypothetical protein